MLSSVAHLSFHRARSESLPDITYENIGQNRVSTYFIRDQNHLLVPRYESRYMKDSLSSNNNNNNGIYIALIHRCSKRITM